MNDALLRSRRPAALTRAAWIGTLLLAAAAAPALAQEIRIGGTGAGLGTMKLLAQAYVKSHPQVHVTVLPSMGSGGGIKAVLAGALHVGVSSRPLNAAEVQAGAVAIEYGRTPFVFAAAAGRKASGITSQQLAEAYASTSATWPDGSKLRLVLRPIGDSDSETIKAISPALREALGAAEQRKGMVFSVTDQEAADSIEKIPGALGPTTLALILSEERQLKALALDGVQPTTQSIADGSYRYTKTLLLVLGPNPSAEARDFVSFVQSPAARSILQQTGHWVK